MNLYTNIETQNDMDRLLDSIAGFHDSMVKEIHLTNRGFVKPDASMDMNHRFDAQVLIQSQWEPFGIELLFTDIELLTLSSNQFYYYEASGKVETIERPVRRAQIHMSFDSSFKVTCESAAYRIRKEWLGKRSFLRSEVPEVSAIPAKEIDSNWRQCTSCHDAWEELPSEEFSYCPSCGQVTQLLSKG